MIPKTAEHFIRLTLHRTDIDVFVFTQHNQMCTTKHTMKLFHFLLFVHEINIISAHHTDFTSLHRTSPLIVDLIHPKLPIKFMAKHGKSPLYAHHQNDFIRWLLLFQYAFLCMGICITCSYSFLVLLHLQLNKNKNNTRYFIENSNYSRLLLTTSIIIFILTSFIIKL